MMRLRREEQGSVMVLAMLVTLVILGIGITVMWVSTSGMKVSTNITRRQEALYAAEVGIERARAMLMANTNWTNLLKGTSCTVALPVFDDYKGLPLCVGTDILRNLGVTAGYAGPASGADPVAQRMVYSVWIRNDWMVECDDKASKAKSVACGKSGKTKGDLDTINTDNNGRVIVRSEGLGRDGLSYVAIEAVISRGVEGTLAKSYTQAGINAQGTNSGKGSF